MPLGQHRGPEKEIRSRITRVKKNHAMKQRPDKDELFEMLQDIEHVNPDVSTDDLEVQETVRLKRKKHPPRRYD